MNPEKRKEMINSMRRIFKNMLPHWKTVFLIFVLLIIQAYGDLSLPQYTSDIIDTGIQNKGVSHVLPEEITKQEFDMAKVFMTQEEKDILDSSYEESGDNYKLTEKNNKKLDEYDDKLMTAIILNKQMAAMEEGQFKSMLARQMNMDEAQLANVPLEALEKQMGMELKTFKKTTDNDDGTSTEITCIDMRPFFKAQLDAGRMSEDDIIKIRQELQDKMDSMGTSLMKSTAITYSIEMDKQAGLDIDKIQTDYLWSEGLKMIALAFMIACAAVLVGLLASKVGAAIGRDLRAEVYHNVIGFSNAEMDKFSTASLITRTTNDVQQIQMMSVMMLRLILYAPIIGVGGIIKVSKTGAGMGWIIALAVLLILGFVAVLMSIAMPKFKLMQKLIDRVNLVSREILTGLLVIRAFGREKTEEKKFDDANKDLTKTMLFTNRVMTFMMPVMMFIMYGISVLIVWVGSHHIDTGDMEVGAMTAFITYAMLIVMAFLMLTMLSVMLPRAAVSADRIDEVVTTHSSIENPVTPEKIEKKQGIVEFDHVNFKYPGADADALHDICFKAELGKTTAIIGSTGCGKSTLVNLIPRLYDVTEGSIKIDGHDIRNVLLKDLRDELGYVPQKGILFSGTIESNIKYGHNDATDEEVKEAAAIAQATEFIEEKDDKYESEISQGGSNVSGGQKQRLSIARAIAKNPKVFIFDDSFSALDLKTDAALRKALAAKVSDSTVIIVAQRVSTILHADQILVMDDGCIVGKGTHEELLRNCETYQQIAKSQLSEKELGLEGGKED